LGNHFADFLEAISAHRASAPALIHGGRVTTWQQFEERAARLAGYLSKAGLRIESKIGIYMQNCSEFMEATFATFKCRGVPVNINYRYQLAELAYLVENADLEGFVFHAKYAGLVSELARRFPQLRVLIEVDDGSTGASPFAVPYETAIADSGAMPRIKRSGDDYFIFYTGGTTGMPKGVMYRHGTYSTMVMPNLQSRGLAPLENLSDLPRFLDDVERAGLTPRAFPLCPLMHLTAMGLGALMPMSLGGSIVTMAGSGLDAKRIWKTATDVDATSLVIVGDAFARALLDELNAAKVAGQPIKAPSLRSIISSGAMWSREIKEEILRHLDILLIDAMGSTEGGMGASITNRAEIVETASFQLHPGVTVFDDDDREILPGSDKIGRVAITGNIPFGYYKDPEKTRKTFRAVGGVIYSFPGDYAKYGDDGRIVLLGRGSSCINTAGEKVFPEEVEEVLKQHPAVHDAAVIGVPDPKFGQRVVAVVAAPGGGDAEALAAFAKSRIAAFKVPKQIFVVPATVRTANGKMDYAWAKAVVEAKGAAAQ
jgi:fatty-acyl-CoA synthase